MPMPPPPPEGLTITGRPDELDPGGVARVWEGGLFGEEAITRVDGFGAAIVRNLHDAIELQVRIGWRRAADVMRLVCIAHVNCIAIRVRVNSGRRDAELATSPHHTNRDLASIGDEDLGEKLALHPTASKGCDGLTTSPSLT